MKKIIALLCLVVLAASSFAEMKKGFSVGMSGRVRTEMNNYAAGDMPLNADKQVYERYTDMRFKPWMGFKMNDMLSAKAVFEIGDIRFGDNATGGAVGTDGKNIEVKHLYMDVKPNKNNMVRVGLQAYYDHHSIIADDDFAGIMWSGKFNRNLMVKAGWLVPADLGETLEKDGDATVTRGTNLFIADGGYMIKKGMTAGAVVAYEKSEINSLMYDVNNIFFAPYFKGSVKAGMDINFSSMLVVNSFTNDYEGVNGKVDQDGMGIAFSLKADVMPQKGLKVKGNFLMATGDKEGKDYYRPVTGFGFAGGQPSMEAMYADTFCSTGLQILSKAAINDRNVHGDFLGNPLGIMLPSVGVEYMVRKNLTVGAAAGMGMFMEDAEMGNNSDAMVGFEFDVTANMEMYKGLNVMPYAAFFMPGDGYAYTQGTEDADMQMKVGASLEFKF